MNASVIEEHIQMVIGEDHKVTKQIYHSPDLIAWGTLEDLTRGDGGTSLDTDLSDASGTGS